MSVYYLIHKDQQRQFNFYSMTNRSLLKAYPKAWIVHEIKIEWGRLRDSKE